MFGSLSTALSALSAHSAAIDVVGNNLANLNTTGYKQNTVSFFEMMNSAGFSGQGESQVGFGVGRPLTFRQFSQGSVQNTSGALDVAIQGDGFLMVKNSQNATLYTRGGNLQVDKNGVLLSPTGEKMQGWVESGGTLATSGPPGDMNIPIGTLRPPIATTSFSADLNLNAAATAGPPATTFSTSLEVFDSLGASHIISVAFNKTANPNEWSYALSVPNADVTSPFYGPPSSLFHTPIGGETVERTVVRFTLGSPRREIGIEAAAIESFGRTAVSCFQFRRVATSRKTYFRFR